MRKSTILFFLLFLFSCSKESDLPTESGQTTVTNESFEVFSQRIDVKRAKKIALETPALFGGVRTKDGGKTIRNCEPVLGGVTTKGGDADTLLYLFNYAEGGYVFIPTDDLDGEVVAYVEQGTFQMSDTTENKLQAFLVNRMIYYRKMRQFIAEQSENQTDDAALTKGAEGVGGGGASGPQQSALIRNYQGDACRDVLTKYRYAGNYGNPVTPPREALTSSGMDYNDAYYKSEGCYMSLTYYNDGSTASRGPLLTTSWGQDGPFNNDAPLIGKYHAVAGCVAIAVAQIMAYHSYPERFPADLHGGALTYIASLRKEKYGSDFSTTGGRAAATFVRTLGDLLGNDWNIRPIGTSAPNNMVGPVFKRMGYPNSMMNYLRYAYNYDMSVNALNNNRPIYINGSHASGGHAWVMDGYKIITTSSEQCTAYFDKNSTYNGKKTISTSSHTTRYFHHNFGWDGQANGYYIDGVFDTSRTSEVTGTPTIEANYHNYQEISIMPYIQKP